MARSTRGLTAAAVLLLAACTGGDDRAQPTTTTAGAPAPTPAASGTVRVAVWDEPDPAAPTLGGAGVRALVLPQLFVAQPDGRWAPALVAPGSDRDGPELRSASFRLRAGAVWSDGAPITADDLRRTADARFVAGVDGPSADGTVTLRFTQPLPGWRRLWSGVDSVAAPRDGVWGGPFTVAGRTPGLETVLRRNEHWHGDVSLEEVRLVLVPDAVTARKLLERGELDVVMPPAATVRTEQLRRVRGVKVATADRTGWSVELLLEPSRLSSERRQDVIDSVERDRFVDTLLRDEATVPEDFDVRPGPVGDIGTVDLVGMYEEPMTFLLQRSMQKRAKPGGGRFELRNAEADRVQGWVARREFDAAIVPVYDPPGACRPCRWGAPDQAVVLPLWQSKAVVAWRTQVEGVRANGYALTAAWNAWEWRAE